MVDIENDLLLVFGLVLGFRKGYVVVRSVIKKGN